jgi:hypothetical protein
MLHLGKQNTKASICSHEPILTPEKKLWRAVLEQTYADAELPSLLDGSEPIERTLARQFLRADTPIEAENLGILCELADLPADRIYLMARRRYPCEQTIDTTVECAGSPPLFLRSQRRASTGVPRRQTEKREPGSRTPNIAA